MIDSVFHVSIGGLKFRLAEDQEGDHYIYSGSSLRPQNAALVGGELHGTQYQSHPNLMLWNVTDWSGGEGALKYDWNNLGRYWAGELVDGLSLPGALKVASGTEKTNLALDVLLAVGANKLCALCVAARTAYVWDDALKAWGSAITNTGVAVGVGATAVCGDSSYVFYKASAGAEIYRWNASATFTLWNNDTGFTQDRGSMAALGKYIYLYDPVTARLWEIPKTGTPPVASTLLLDESFDGGMVQASGRFMLAVGSDRLYCLQQLSHACVVWEITPTSAAAAGFASEIARLDGFKAQAIDVHFDFIYLHGTDINEVGGSNYDRQILYLQPDGSFGTLGRLRAELGAGSRSPTTGNLSNNLTGAGFALQTSSSVDPFLWKIDSVSGGVFCTSKFVGASTSTDIPVGTSLVTWEGEYFWSSPTGGSQSGVWRTVRDKYHKTVNATEAFAISSIWDFGVAEEKTFQSLQLSCEPLPAGWTVFVDYQKNRSGSWVNIGSYSVANGAGTSWQIASDPAVSGGTIFRTIQFRIRFQYTGALTLPTTTPVVLHIQASASVGKAIPSWTLLLSVQDEHGEMAGRALSGAQQLDHLQTLFTSRESVSFLDGYHNRNPNSFATYNVTIDAWHLLLDRPQEGMVQLRLLEVPG